MGLGTEGRRMPLTQWALMKLVPVKCADTLLFSIIWLGARNQSRYLIYPIHRHTGSLQQASSSHIQQSSRGLTPIGQFISRQSKWTVYEPNIFMLPPGGRTHFILELKCATASTKAGLSDTSSAPNVVRNLEQCTTEILRQRFDKDCLDG